MSEENAHRENSGVLFPNSQRWIDGKQGRPDFGGEVTISGKRWRLAGWKKDLPDGREFISLSFSLPQPKPARIANAKPN